jgi:YVTN family beta-propeller protein
VTRFGTLIVLLLAACGCRVGSPELKPAREAGGMLLVYARPLQPEAERLRFRIAGMVARAEDGTTVPLRILAGDAHRGSWGRERLLATGTLPPGRYAGLAATIASATLAGPAGDAELLVPEEPVEVDLLFDLSRDSTRVVTLALDYRVSVTESYAFTPVFGASFPAELPNGLIALASCPDTDTVTLFDKTTGRATNVIRTGREPMGMALGRGGRTAFVALSAEAALEAVDLLANRVTNRLPLNGGDHPLELTLTPDGETLLVVNEGSDSVSFIDPDSLIETGRVSVGDGPRSILVGPAGNRAWVFNGLDNTISVVDLRRRFVETTIATEARPVRGDLDRGGTRLYVIHRNSPNMLAIDAVTMTVLRRVHVGAGASAIKVDPRSDRIYVARKGMPEIEVYDPFSLLPIDSIPVDGDVGYMTIDDESNNLLLVLTGKRRIRTVRLVGGQTVADVDLDGAPYWVSVVGER